MTRDEEVDKKVANGTRVKLTCAQSYYEYSIVYTDKETDHRHTQVADIDCVDGEFTKHNLTCETESKEGSTLTPIKCTHIDNGNITNQGLSVKCHEGYTLWFENEMDASLYTVNSCKCNQTTGRIQCSGTNVQCKPIGCKIPTYLEQGLTLYDPFQRTPTSGANRYEIKHNEFLTFTCSHSGDTFFEPNKRMFVCDKGLWSLKQRDSEKPWDLGNNGSFPKCRPVNCPIGFCKFGGRCTRDQQCECPKNESKGNQCEILSESSYTLSTIKN
ncbi:hypothetical protein DPMN_153678 [Dreissena polymorpha]|uniref:Uncharacterized protein n=1 Tax=Dreissena polymorpha TaxID=45954 RepID=A0A9D4FMS7_DREPO|nr:hypothetical protein DPMN_153678 [Dreissena polymorpha]